MSSKLFEPPTYSNDALSATSGTNQASNTTTSVVDKPPTTASNDVSSEEAKEASKRKHKQLFDGWIYEEYKTEACSTSKITNAARAKKLIAVITIGNKKVEAKRFSTFRLASNSADRQWNRVQKQLYE